MSKDLLKISELKSIREQKLILVERENELIAPILFDFDLIPCVRVLFNEIVNEMGLPPMSDNTTQRKKFVFIILFLFAPGILAGGRLPNGLRGIISETIGLKDITFISHNIKTVIFLYQYDKYFRMDVEHMYTEIANRLKDKGLIK